MTDGGLVKKKMYNTYNTFLTFVMRNPCGLIFINKPHVYSSTNFLVSLIALF